MIRHPVTEQALFYSYRNDPAVLALKVRQDTEWRRPCACRGIVLADPDDPAPGVSEHNVGPAHQLWRRRKEGVHGPSDAVR